MSNVLVEFRIPERKAAKHLSPNVGRLLGGSVRVVNARPGTALFDLIGREDRSLFRGSFFYSFQIRRRYRPAELAAAEALTMSLTTRFEPTGEECGTVYDVSTACRKCRTGRTQRSDLMLDLRTVPRRDIAISIGGEIVVSDRFRELVEQRGFTGMSFQPVVHGGRTALRTGRRIYQLGFTGPRPSVLTPPTQFGETPFDFDDRGAYRCPLGHVAGLNLLSEVTIDAATWPEVDATSTVQHVGNPRGQGLLVPEPLLICSPRFHQAIVADGLTGARFEVAYLGHGPA